MSFFSRRSRRQVGVDIGSSSIKAVELSRQGSDFRLENYGLITGFDFFPDSFSPAVPSTFKLSENEIAAGLAKLLEFSKIKTHDAVLSIPVFSSFLTVMELPRMKMDELEKAVPFEARSYIPVPLSEVTIDWLALPPREPVFRQALPVAGAEPQPESSGSKTISVLLIAVPKEIIAKYQRIAEGAKLNLRAMESESFSAIRSLAGNDLAPLVLIDFGARSTTLTLVDQGFVRMNHTLDLAGRELTQAIAHGIGVSPERAEELKRTSGIIEKEENAHGLAALIKPLLNRLTSEFEKMSDLYMRKEGQKIQKIILGGGSASLPGLVVYLKKELGVEVILGNPFTRISYSGELKDVLTGELASYLTVAAGGAMREI